MEKPHWTCSELETPPWEKLSAPHAALVVRVFPAAALTKSVPETLVPLQLQVCRFYVSGCPNTPAP